MSRLGGHLEVPGIELATRFSYALVPLGFSMWLAHYSFHFVGSFEAIIPVLQRLLGDMGWTGLGEPAWVRACCKPVADWLPRLEILFLDVGMLLSLYTGYRIAQDQAQRGSQALKLLAPLGDADRRTLRAWCLGRSPTHADAWNPARGRIEMRPVAAGLAITWLMLSTWCSTAGADGGTMRLSATKGGYQITVFTAQPPSRAGPVDISVVVQDRLTGMPLTQTRVTVRMSRPGQPSLEYPATAEAATNKLFQAALFELPEAGRWRMEVEIESAHGSAMIAGDVEAAAPVPRWQELWPWFGWPVLAVTLFGLHQFLSRPKRGEPGRNL